jgi:rhodanese-related sulfurtransferase
MDRDAFVVLDVRSPAEFASGHIEGAVNVPLEALAR